ncbi:MAG: hypothetical protein MK101_06590 [Phycisphaerales bacterium]|nr:hypothetical protein [Phycisphaerales bacterium]
MVPTQGDWADSWFGAALDIAADTIVVGAPRWDESGGNSPPPPNADCGAAWVFDAQVVANAQGAALPQAPLMLSQHKPGDHFGCAVAVDGDRAIVGAWGRDSSPDEQDNCGAAFVFERQQSGQWALVSTLMPPAPQAGERSGVAVDINGDVAIVSAPYFGNFDGRVHVYVRSGGSWAWQQTIDNPGTVGARFGSAVHLALAPGNSGGVDGGVMIGAPGDSGAGPQAGAAWGFNRQQSGHFSVLPDYDVTPSDVQPWDGAGASVEVIDLNAPDANSEGAVLLVGSPNASNNAGRFTAFTITQDVLYEEFSLGPPDTVESHGRYGHALEGSVHIMPEWGQPLLTLLASAPGDPDSSVGGMTVHEVILAIDGGDCDGDEVWDFLALHQGLGDCDGDGVYDACQVKEDLDSDCNLNGVVDVCELNPDTDCDNNGLLDECEPDLDGDGITDACDDDRDGDGHPNGQDQFPDDSTEWSDLDGDGVGDNSDPDIDGDGHANGVDAFPMDPSEWADLDGDGIGDNADPDDDNDGIPDHCDADFDPASDCDGNGMIDSCEVDSTTDCNADGVLDLCQLNPMTDCDGNQVLDACEMNSVSDCNGDGLLDLCQLDAVTDCNQDGVLDACQIDPATDCDDNGVLDECQGGPGDDCNMDSVPDVCQLNGQTDCNGNDILDECEPGWEDCDSDGVADLCQIMHDPSLDCNQDGILDSCQTIGDVGDPSWSTERFFGDWDLNGLGVTLTPTANPLTWDTCTIDTGGQWLFDPAIGTDLPLGDDQAIDLTLPFTFNFMGQFFDSVYVGSNGYLTFTTADHAYSETLEAHFAMMRISGLFDDLDPSDTGTIRVGPSSDGQHMVFSWIDVAHYRYDPSDPLRKSSFQIVLGADGLIDLCWVSSEANSALVGLSAGLGRPPAFAETDLSNAFDCVFRVPDGYGDCDGDGTPDNCQVPLNGDPIYLTEQFMTSFDLVGHVAQLNPTGNSNEPYYTLCTDGSGPAAFIPPSGGVTLPPSDDAPQEVIYASADPALSGFVFNYDGVATDRCWVSPNGYVTFDRGDSSYDETLATHFAQPRISGLLHDLNPVSGGYVHVGAGPAGSFVVTWNQVPSFGDPSRLSTVQIQLHPNDAITIVWLGVQTPHAIVGVSTGGGVPSNFLETDYSLAHGCELHPSQEDCNANGIFDSVEIMLGCTVDQDQDGVPDECFGYNGSWDPFPCAGDSDGSRSIDIVDLIGMLQCWGSTQGACYRSDMNEDGTVGPADVLLLIEQLGTPCD